jgi:hypothetical protein
MQSLDALDIPVWGAAAMGQVIGRTERQVFHMLEAGHLPARKVGRKWVCSRARLLAYLTEDKRA